MNLLNLFDILDSVPTKQDAETPAGMPAAVQVSQSDGQPATIVVPVATTDNTVDNVEVLEDEHEDSLDIGDEVIITGNVQFKGKTGRIVDFGKNKHFVIVDLYNFGKHSFHSSNVEHNDYADSEEEANDWQERELDENWVKFGSRYAEELALKIFKQYPDLSTKGQADELLDAGWKIAAQDLGVKRAQWEFNYDEDFVSDFVSAYAWLQHGGNPETGEDGLEEGWKQNLAALGTAAALGAGGMAAFGSNAGAAPSHSGPELANPQQVVQMIKAGKIASSDDLVAALSTAKNKNQVWSVLQNAAGMQGSSDVNGVIQAIQQVREQGVAEGKGPQSKIDQQIIDLLVSGTPAKTIARKLDIPVEWVHEVSKYNMPGTEPDYSDPRNSRPANRFGEGVAEGLPGSLSKSDYMPGAVRHDLSNIKSKNQEPQRDRPVADIDPDWENWKKEQAAKRKKQGVAEAKSLAKRVRVVKTGETGTIRQVKHGAYKGAAKTYYVDLDNGGQADNLPASALRLIKDDVEEGFSDSRLVNLPGGDRSRPIPSERKYSDEEKKKMYNDWVKSVADKKKKEQGVAEGLEDSNIQSAIVDTVERLFRKNEISDYGALEAIRQGIKHHFSKPGATTESAIEGILNILDKRMRKSGDYVDLGRFKEALRQGIAHQLNKQGVAEGSKEEFSKQDTLTNLHKLGQQGKSQVGIDAYKKAALKHKTKGVIALDKERDTKKGVAEGWGAERQQRELDAANKQRAEEYREVVARHKDDPEFLDYLRMFLISNYGGYKAEKGAEQWIAQGKPLPNWYVEMKKANPEKLETIFDRLGGGVAEGNNWLDTPVSEELQHIRRLSGL